MADFKTYTDNNGRNIDDPNEMVDESYDDTVVKQVNSDSYEW